LRHKASLDANHVEIVQGLRQVGATVVDLAKVGKGCPDLLVGWRGRTYLFEIKTTKGYIRATQEQFFRSWVGGRIAVIRSFDEALDVLTEV
jgi:Holliday junction resolvase